MFTIKTCDHIQMFPQRPIQLKWRRLQLQKIIILPKNVLKKFPAKHYAPPPLILMGGHKLENSITKRKV